MLQGKMRRYNAEFLWALLERREMSKMTHNGVICALIFENGGGIVRASVVRFSTATKSHIT